MKRITVAAAVVVLALTGCGGGGKSSSAPAAAVDKYVQTWSTPYDKTTCAQWNQDMTKAQQFAAAADMLTGARNKKDGGHGLPPDELITQFKDAVSTSCVVDTMTIVDAAVGVYLTERATFKP